MTNPLMLCINTHRDSISLFKVSGQLLDATREGSAVLHVGHSTAHHPVTRLDHLHTYTHTHVDARETELTTDSHTEYTRYTTNITDTETAPH